MAYQIAKHEAQSVVDMSNNTGGINLAMRPDALEANQCADAVNFEISFYGSKFKTRPAISASLHNTDFPITSFWWDEITKSLYFFVGEHNKPKKMYYFDTKNNHVNFVGDLTGRADRPSCVYFHGNLFVASGDKLQVLLLYEPEWLKPQHLKLLTLDGKYTNAGKTSLNSPLVTTLAVKDSRLVATAARTDTIYFSSINDCLSAKTLGLVDDSDDRSAAKYIEGIGESDNSAIIGMVVNVSDIIVFKYSGSCYSISGNAPDWYVTKVADNSDAIKQSAIVSHANTLIFMSTSGFKELKTKASHGNYSLEEFGMQVNPAIAEHHSDPWGRMLDDRHQLIFSSDRDKMLWVHSTSTGGFTKWVVPDGFVVNDMIETPDGVYVALETVKNKYGQLCKLDDTKSLDFGTTPIHQLYKSKQLSYYDLLTSHIQNIRVKPLDEETGAIDIYVKTGTQIALGSKPYHLIRWKYSYKNPIKHVRSQIRDESLQYIIETDSPFILEHFSESVIQNANGKGNPSGGQWSDIANSI
jgi:hypothetical protein